MGISSRQRTAQDILKQIEAVEQVDKYLASKLKRQDLASLYMKVANIGIDYPPRLNTRLYLVQKLKRSVSATCPSCVRPKDMTNYIKQAIAYLNNYKLSLIPIATGDEEIKSIHDLDTDL